MRQVVFVQGGGAGVHDHWDIRLVEDLGRRLGAGYAIHYPRMPDEAEPHFAAWDRALRNVWSGLGANAVLVGHSVGATILVHSLAAAPLPVAPAGLFLIAPPFIGPGGWPSDEIDPRSGPRAARGAGLPLPRQRGRDRAPAPSRALRPGDPAGRGPPARRTRPPTG